MLRLDVGHHTLTCGACGAPLNKLKSIPIAVAPAKAAVSHQPKLRKLPKAAEAKRSRPPKRQKKRKSLFRKFAEEAFDLVEDIFD